MGSTFYKVLVGTLVNNHVSVYSQINPKILPIWLYNET